MSFDVPLKTVASMLFYIAKNRRGIENRWGEHAHSHREKTVGTGMPVWQTKITVGVGVPTCIARIAARVGHARLGIERTAGGGHVVLQNERTAVVWPCLGRTRNT